MTEVIGLAASGPNINAQFGDSDPDFKKPISRMTDHELCQYALAKYGEPAWRTETPYKLVVRAAKRKGLTPQKCQSLG